MATLVSPGVSVPVTDQSFYIPASAPTVPLLFIATQANKLQPDGVSSAAGTTENGVIRTVTSLGQSVQLYGNPHFMADSSGNQFHGDARNEYGLFALNQFIGVGNLAYVVRANIDLTDAAKTFISAGVPTYDTPTFVGVGNGTITGITATSAFVQLDTIQVVMNSSTAFTVQGVNAGIIGTGIVGTPFTSTTVNFTINAGSTPYSGDDYFQFDLVYAPSSFTGTGNGNMTGITPASAVIPEIWSVVCTSITVGATPATFSVTGSVSGPSGTATAGSPFSNSQIDFLITEGSVPFGVNAEFQITLSQVNLFNPLGANDAAKRVSIVTALAAEINSNTLVRSELYEYNLIVCPGYPEVATDMLALSDEINDEAFTISEVPCNLTPDQAANWALTAARAASSNIGYYYPWGLAANLDGTLVAIAPSGIALRTYAFSDNQSYVWFAPAGLTRGTVTGVSDLGYVSGTLGTATTFTQSYLNQGQRDNLYQYPTNINPIVFFPGQGMIVWGNKTSQGAASALDRINVVRLVMYIKRQLRKGSFPFVFEPNDVITQGNLKASADGFLNGIMALRGLYDFVTLCNSSNNPPSVVQANEMFMDVAIHAVTSTEFIYIPIRVLALTTALPS
jgi:hypothetical protein